MYYNVYEGMQNTWSDRFNSIIKPLTGHNWLPAAVGCLVALWIGLLLAAINQTGPANPGEPSNVGTAESTSGMTVAPATDTAALAAPPASSSANTNPPTTVQNAATSPTATKAPATPSSEGAVAGVIGGRGADGTAPPQSNTAPSTSTDGTSTDTTSGLGLSVQTPLTPDPITVGLDLNSGLQVDLGL
jgi:hypothetical protein